MISTGLADAGYKYLVIDGECLSWDCQVATHMAWNVLHTDACHADAWSNRLRGTHGRIEANDQKFPSGMKAIADYVHEKG